MYLDKDNRPDESRIGLNLWGMTPFFTKIIIKNFLGNAENIENMLEAYEFGVSIYRLCNTLHHAARIRVNGITKLREFTTKFPYQLSDRDDPVSAYSEIQADDLPTPQSYENRRQIIRQLGTNEVSDEMANFVTKKQFVDVNDTNWREISFKQNDLGKSHKNSLTEK